MYRLGTLSITVCAALHPADKDTHHDPFPHGYGGRKDAQNGVAKRIRGLSDRTIAWIFVAPTIFLLLAVNIFPLIWTIRLSFTNFRVNRPNNDVEWVGLRNYERILRPRCLGTMQATAHFLIWTIALQVLIGFYAGLSDQQEIQRQRYVDHDHRVPDDVVARRCRKFLDVSVPAADRLVQLCR